MGEGVELGGGGGRRSGLVPACRTNTRTRDYNLP